jgi:energy-coupling factor transport system permease protein
MVSSVLFWDLRFLVPLLVIALVVVFTSGIKWREMYRAWLFIGGFVVFFSLLTFLTGRGGMEFYTE